MSFFLVDPGELMAAAATLRRLSDEAHACRDRMVRGEGSLGVTVDLSTLWLWERACVTTGVVAARVTALQEATKAAADLYALRDAEVEALAAQAGRMQGKYAHESLLQSFERVGQLTEKGATGEVTEVALFKDNPRVSEDPRSIEDLITSDAWLDGRRERVRVIGIPQPGGGFAWIVMIPGTQESHFAAGKNPFDPTTDARIMNGESTLADQGVAQALAMAKQAQGREGLRDPVLLTGHSLGGIIAAKLAADPQFRADNDVRAVLTAGSPVDAFAVPRGIPMISIEHPLDPVPLTDGPTPEREGLTRYVLPQPGIAALRSHDGALYAASARLIDEIPSSRDRGLAAWRAAARPFLSRSSPRGQAPVDQAPVVRDYTVSRKWHNPPP